MAAVKKVADVYQAMVESLDRVTTSERDKYHYYRTTLTSRCD